MNKGTGRVMKEIFRRHQPAAEMYEKSADNLWVRCPRCRELLYAKELEQSLWVCSKCKYHYPVTARRRIEITVDPGTFEEFDPHMSSVDPLEFRSLGDTYREKLEQYRQRAEADEAFIYGFAKIDGQDTVVGVNEFQFSGGSMGAVSGEKVTRAIELAIERQIPLILFSTSGGARMQEGTISLLQMAKTI